VIGDLSPDQTRAVDALQHHAGLDRGVAGAWIVTAVGSGVHRPDHNYTGHPAGWSFPSVGHAARHLDATMPDEVRGAGAAGPVAQLHAVAAWQGLDADELVGNWIRLGRRAVIEGRT
jgi:hypothetical protein